MQKLKRSCLHLSCILYGRPSKTYEMKTYEHTSLWLWKSQWNQRRFKFFRSGRLNKSSLMDQCSNLNVRCDVQLPPFVQQPTPYSLSLCRLSTLSQILATVLFCNHGWRRELVIPVKARSHGKVKFANSCCQTHVGGYNCRENSFQTYWQTDGKKLKYSCQLQILYKSCLEKLAFDPGIYV